ncbi:RRP15-like protein [Procambarus clarkii]|uniref:RRP15-like protein n=1 Tax=Procambarus clarkii TaxID=6728 RepID=UPI0037420B27
MAISRRNLKKPQVVEEESDSELDENSEMEPEDDEMEVNDDVKNIKQEVEDDDSDDNNETAKEIKREIPDENDMEDNCETDDSSSIEIKEEDESDIDSEEIDDDLKGTPEADQSAETGPVKSAMKSVRFVQDHSDESEMDSVDDIDDYGTDESEKEIESDEENNKESSGKGLANVMAKILATKKSNNVILSKAKKTNKVQEKAEDSSDDNFEIVDDSGKIKKEPDIKEEKEEQAVPESQHKRELQKKIWENRFRVKPNIKDDREKERRLRVLATQGVVQLFSAIEKHKNLVQRKLSETRSIMGREKVLETTGKEAFLEVLRQQGKKVKTPKEEESFKEEIKDEPLDIPAKKKPRWNVLADNFYKEPTLQGWDQQSDED